MSQTGDIDGFVLAKSTPSALVESDQDSQAEEEMDKKQVTVTMSIEEMKKYFASAQVAQANTQQTNKKVDINQLAKIVKEFDGKDSNWLLQ